MSKTIALIASATIALGLFLFACINGSVMLGMIGAAIAFATAGAWILSRTKPVIEDDHEMISMVGLFKTIPFLDEAVLAKHVQLAWGIEFEVGDEAETFVAGSSPLFVIKTEDRMYTINHFDRPYFDDVDTVVENLSEVRMKHVLESHQGWVSVDLMSKSDNIDIEYEYSKIGQLLNEMVDAECLGILIPHFMRLVPWNNSTAQAITSLNPLRQLAPSNPPVVPIEDDDPKMHAAVLKARAGWGQFVNEFELHMRDECRDESRCFSIKAPITAGGSTEFIWVTVTGIENNIIYGTLANEPVSLPGHSEGDRVRAPVPSVNDWVYTQSKGGMVGGFTIKVLTEWTEAHRKMSKSKQSN